MKKEEYYNKIKIFIYRKFEELEVVKRNNRNELYLRYKNGDSAQIMINKNSGWVYYFRRFRYKIDNMIRLEQDDFEILLSRWVEDTFQIKVNHIHCTGFGGQFPLKIPFK